MSHAQGSSKFNDRRKSDLITASPDAADQAYKVGPGFPPKEHQFKRGKSGNPQGRKPKSPTMDLDLKVALKRALDKKVQLKQGERERAVTMAVAGIEQLVAQYAKGDRYARRDMVALADKLGVDLVAAQTNGEETIAASHQAILDDFLFRQYDKVMERETVMAPPELLDDDEDDKSRS